MRAVRVFIVNGCSVKLCWDDADSCGPAWENAYWSGRRAARRVPRVLGVAIFYGAGGVLPNHATAMGYAAGLGAGPLAEHPE
jgi:hypothetical protein